MLPHIFLGPWRLSTYTVLAGIGMAVGGVWIYERARALPMSARTRWLLVALVALSGWLGAIAGQAATNAIRAARLGPTAPHEGLSIIWGLVAGILVWALACWTQRVNVAAALDVVALPIPLAQAIARLGCHAAGCCAGLASDGLLGVLLPDTQGVWMVRYPTQLLSAGANLLIVAVLLAVQRRSRRHPPPPGESARPFGGFLFLLYVLLFSLKRLTMGFLRAGVDPVAGGLGWMQLYALVGLVSSAALIALGARAQRRERRR